jgi:hypothetical protein
MYTKGLYLDCLCKPKEKKMAYYKVTMKQTWEWEVLVHAKDSQEALKVIDVCDWGEPVSEKTETVSILELMEKPTT